MSLLPRPTFEVRLPPRGVVPGEKLKGLILVNASKPIPRARFLHLEFKSVARAEYRAESDLEYTERLIFQALVRADIPGKRLDVGVHRVPFAIDVPGHLIPGIEGESFYVRHNINVHLDVDFAVDPHATFDPHIALPPREALRLPATVRSPAGFHDSVVLELTFPSTAIIQGEPLVGRVALRGGHDAKFSSVDISLANIARINMGRGDRRRIASSMVHVPRDALRAGEPVAFNFPAQEHLPPTFYSPYVDHQFVLSVSLVVPWGTPRKFEHPIQVWPRGSVLLGDATAAPLGNERLARIASAMAQTSGLRLGRLPVLVEGTDGLVDFRVEDAPRDGNLGVALTFSFPNTELGLTLRRRSLLEFFQESTLLPLAMRDKHALSRKPKAHRPAFEEATLEQFCAAVLHDTQAASDLQLSDHHQSLHVTLADDTSVTLNHAARWAIDHARRITTAILALPFPAEVASGLAAWTAAALERDAKLMPTGPALYGLRLSSRVTAGAIVTLDAVLRTTWSGEGPATRIDIRLPAPALPTEARAELEAPTPSLSTRQLHALFPVARVVDDGRVVSLERSGFTPDPRDVLQVLDVFMAWLLTVRGEHPANAPYR